MGSLTSTFPLASPGKCTAIGNNQDSPTRIPLDNSASKSWALEFCPARHSSGLLASLLQTSERTRGKSVFLRRLPCLAAQASHNI